MNGKFIIDANVIIDYLRGKNNLLSQLMENEVVSISVIVIGELIFGAENSIQIKKHLSQVEELLSKVNIVGIDYETAKIYGKIRADLRKKGTPIPENDIWIAATAMQHNFTLITNDKHFANINLLKYKEL
ncbi:MAG TPA: VapC toxin family PIN domain ribonuclease [Flavobacterium sp.]|nr:VapC toxin family PIN domain ribonuclease [Flavobacterium sp.]HAT76586.1 VapC toxin family PIN domain ribonuclease [Flavobacterium sp.]HAT80024.1 VapC toxin family PIN domain ribonuclease [Flavobacterium sp.]